jgi:hypothetical protein
MSETIDEGAELVAVVRQTAPLAKVQDLKMLRSSLSMIQQQGNIDAEKMFQHIENSREIVQRKVLLVFENHLNNRSDALELLRMSLFANGWTEEGVFTCPVWKVAMKIWPAVMECLDVLIEERQRENSATFGKAVCERAGSEWRGVNSCAKGVPGLATGGSDQDPGGSASGRRVAEGSNGGADWGRWNFPSWIGSVG